MTRAILTAATLAAAMIGLGLLAAAPAFAGEKAHTRVWGDPHVNEEPAPSGATTGLTRRTVPARTRSNFPALSHNKIYAHSTKPRRVRPLRARRLAR